MLGETLPAIEVRSRIKTDFRIGQFRPEGFQRRGRKPDVVLPVCFTLAWWHDRVSARRVHLRRSSAGKHANISMSSNDRNAVHLGRIDGKHLPVVLQEDDAFLLNSLRYFESLLDIDDAFVRWIINHSRQKLGIQYSSCMIVNLRQRH